MKKVLVGFAVAVVFSIVPVASSTVLAIGATTNPASNITYNSATLSGTVTASQSDFIYAIALSGSSSFGGSIYSYSGACDLAQQVDVRRGQVGGGSPPVAYPVTGEAGWNASCVLNPSTTYYFKIGVQDGISGCSNSMSCYTWGTTESFTTRAAVLPSATTDEASEIGPDSAKLNSTTVATDGSAVITYEYGTSPTLLSAKTLTLGTKYPTGNSGPTTGWGTGVITGLIESTKYYFRVVATSTYGTVRGEIKSFTTRAPVGISVNDADDFTTTPGVTISVSWPNGAESMLVSNDGGFRQQKSYALTDSIPWTLNSTGDERLPKTVYLKFVMTDGTRSSTYSDDIILDTTAPVVTQATAVSVKSSSGVSISAVRKNAVRLTVTSSDANSGIDHLEVKTSPRSTPAAVSVMKTGKVTKSVVFRTTKRSFLVRAVDRAGNPSTKWVKVAAKG